VIRGKTHWPTLLFLLILASVFPAGSSAQSQPQLLRVAAAADLQFVMPDLAAQFERRTGTKVNITFGSSGNFYSQLQNGAPFDLFFSADIDYPRELEAAGLAEPGTLFEYAVGRIAIWTPADTRVDVARQRWNALLDSAVQKIAIANPEHAPYGRAAVAALKKAGIYEQVKAKLVYGENISQASQFVQSGNAQAGIVTMSLVLSPGMKDGKRWEIPAEMHPPIDQAVIVLKSAANKPGARAFLEFVKSESGLSTFSNYGFSLPPALAAPPIPPRHK
jgi:molybdate transport system substrate-binding protein